MEAYLKIRILEELILIAVHAYTRINDVPVIVNEKIKAFISEVLV